MKSNQKQSLGLVKAFFRGEVKRLTQTPWPVRFFFFCDEEAKAYRLSSALQKRGHDIVSCEPVEDADKWLVLSEEMLIFDNEVLIGRLDLYEGLAAEYEVDFDGWESLMPE